MATTDRSEAARALVVQYLGEAHATEAALVTTLQAHITMTPRGAYRQLLERHLAETRQQAGAIERRLAELDGGSSLVGTAIGLVHTVVGQILALSKAPIDLLRGASGEEKLLKNAKDECATEALEIATYDALEAAAREVGDEDTAALAKRHRAQEERMLEALRREIPTLALATIRERVGGEPVYDIGTTGAAEAVRDRESTRRLASAAGEARDAMRGVRDAADGEASPASGRAAAEPLPGYDALNAGQVIARLRGLSPQRRRAVAAYERAHRNRSTVLARIDALERGGGRRRAT